MRANVIKAVTYGLGLFLLVVLVTVFREDYLKGGWLGVCYDVAFMFAAWVWLRYLRRNFETLSLAGHILKLRAIFGRLYTVTATLPEGKFPIHFVDMSILELLKYAHRILDNEVFWEEVPEKISFIEKDYVATPYAVAEHEQFEPRDCVRETMRSLVLLIEQMLVTSVR